MSQHASHFSLCHSLCCSKAKPSAYLSQYVSELLTYKDLNNFRNHCNQKFSSPTTPYSRDLSPCHPSHQSTSLTALPPQPTARAAYQHNPDTMLIVLHTAILIAFQTYVLNSSNSPDIRLRHVHKFEICTMNSAIMAAPYVLFSFSRYVLGSQKLTHLSVFCILADTVKSCFLACKRLVLTHDNSLILDWYP